MGLPGAVSAKEWKAGRNTGVDRGQVRPRREERLRNGHRPTGHHDPSRVPGNLFHQMLKEVLKHI